MKKKIFILIILSFFKTINAQTFSGLTGLVSDDGLVNEFPLSVSGLPSTTLNSSLGLTQVCLNISHSYVSDLNVTLVSPDGTFINLFSTIGGDGDNFNNTCLNQSAPTSINIASPPFTGTFKPQQSLSVLNNNQNGNGIWKLRIIDTYPQDQGNVISWNITFSENATVPVVFTNSNLPIIIINTNGVPIQDEPSINATMGIVFNGDGNINSVTDVPNNYNGNILIEYRGNYSQTLPQKPYKIETIDAANAELDVSILGMPAEHDWVLIASYNDKVFMRNTLAYNLFTNMGHYAARHKFCEVIVNGSYQGVYVFMESIKRDNNRVNIAKLDSDENTGNNLTGGYILKNDYWTNEDSWLLSNHPIDHPELDVHLVYEYPKPLIITPQQKTYIQTFINNFETALYSSNFTSTTTGYRNYIDTSSFIDYLIVNELSRNNDGFKKSSFFHKDKNTSSITAKLKAGPVWDFDWAWKNINECSIFSATDGSGWAYLVNNCSSDNNSTGWFVRLLQDPNFQSEFHCRWINLRSTILSNAAITNYIDTNALLLQQAQARHFEKWGNLGANTGSPEIEDDPSTFEEQIIKFKNWINLRLTWLDTNIPGDISSCVLSATENNKSSIIIFPNPTKNNFSIIFPNNEQNFNISVKIIDMIGRTMQKTKLQNSNESINVENYEKGTYLVEILSNGNLFKTKLLIE